MKNRFNPEIQPEEIFGDALNIPGFDEEQFEGRIEKPIPKYVAMALGGFFLFVAVFFGGRAWQLQVAQGDSYSDLASRNHLRNIPVFAERGVIYDRNKTELAWNIENKDKSFFARAYAKKDGLGHVLGYVSLPKLDSSGHFWQTEAIGLDGVEKQYDEMLKGKNGKEVVETDAADKIISKSTIMPPLQGDNLILTIDAGVTEKLYQSIQDLAHQVGFTGGAGIIMDVNSGEILALTSYPEYSSEVLVLGKDRATIQSYLNNKQNLFLNRAVSGLYTPGSIVKPYVAVGALAENIIDPQKQILSTGSISIPNPYDPTKETVFKDWRAQGWVDMRRAIAVSSDVYFYVVGGGYKDQKGLGIANIDKYAKAFGFAEKTGVDLPGESEGVIPTPEWKAENFNGEKWLIGNTYHTAIGQYGFQVTALQAVRAVAALANGGTLVIPHVRAGAKDLPSEIVPIDPQYFVIPREGMRQSVTEGIAQGLSLPGVKVAAKSGTAELGMSRAYVNSWITGFFPYDNPKYAFAVVMEHAPRTNTIGALYVMRQTFDWMTANTPEYLK